MFKEATESKKVNDDVIYCGPTSFIQKTLKEIIHEIWNLVIPIVCPHCNGKSPSFRKDGYTKIFQKALSEKVKASMK